MTRLPLSLLSGAALALAATLALPAAAQQPPPKLEPLPEPPPQVGLDPAPPGPGVTITPGTGGERVEEFTIDGRKYIRVIQPNGFEYYLVEDLPGFGPAGTNPHDSRVRVPQWVIMQF